MIGWRIRSAEGRVSRTAHLFGAGGQALCGWSQSGGWAPAHAYSPRCGRCVKAEAAALAPRRLVADEPAPGDLMDSWADECADHA